MFYDVNTRSYIGDKYNHTYERTNYISQDFVLRLSLKQELFGHNGCVNCLEWNKTGEILASGSDDFNVIIWDPFREHYDADAQSSSNILHVIKTNHHGNIFSVKFLPNSNDNIIITGAADKRVCLFDLNYHSKLDGIYNEDATIVPNNSSMHRGFWNTNSLKNKYRHRLIKSYACHKGRVKRLAVTEIEPSMVWSIGEDGYVMQYDTRLPQCLHHPPNIHLSSSENEDSTIFNETGSTHRDNSLTDNCCDNRLLNLNTYAQQNKTSSFQSNGGSSSLTNGSLTNSSGNSRRNTAPRWSSYLDDSTVEGKSLALNPLRPEMMAIGCNDPYVRIFDRRFLTFPIHEIEITSARSENDATSYRNDNVPLTCCRYLIPGHIPFKTREYRRKFRSLTCTDLTFSPDGTELLVNLGGEQIYLFDTLFVLKPRTFTKNFSYDKTSSIKDDTSNLAEEGAIELINDCVDALTDYSDPVSLTTSITHLSNITSSLHKSSIGDSILDEDDSISSSSSLSSQNTIICKDGDADTALNLRPSSAASSSISTSSPSLKRRKKDLSQSPNPPPPISDICADSCNNSKKLPPRASPPVGGPDGFIVEEEKDFIRRPKSKPATYASSKIAAQFKRTIKETMLDLIGFYPVPNSEKKRIPDHTPRASLQESSYPPKVLPIVKSHDRASNTDDRDSTRAPSTSSIHPENAENIFGLTPKFPSKSSSDTTPMPPPTPQSPTTTATTIQDSCLPPPVRILKDEANSHFRSGNYFSAINVYNSAIDLYGRYYAASAFVPATYGFRRRKMIYSRTRKKNSSPPPTTIRGGGGSPISKYKSDEVDSSAIAILYCNRAAALIKRDWDGDNYEAMKDCFVALRLDASNVKARFRFIKCLLELGKIKESRLCLERFKTFFHNLTSLGEVETNSHSTVTPNKETHQNGNVKQQGIDCPVINESNCPEDSINNVIAQNKAVASALKILESQVSAKEFHYSQQQQVKKSSALRRNPSTPAATTPLISSKVKKSQQSPISLLKDSQSEFSVTTSDDTTTPTLKGGPQTLEHFLSTNQEVLDFVTYAKDHLAIRSQHNLSHYYVNNEETNDNNASFIKPKLPFFSNSKEASSSINARNEFIKNPQSKERYWRKYARDYSKRFCGHCNTTTDIKQANFFGSEGQYIVAGSDDGYFFIWDKGTTNIVKILVGDGSIVNCLQPNPVQCLLATSGIDSDIRLWGPGLELPPKWQLEGDYKNNEEAAATNQKRMNADPIEIMLMNLGYRIAVNTPSLGTEDIFSDTIASGRRRDTNFFGIPPTTIPTRNDNASFLSSRIGGNIGTSTRISPSNRPSADFLRRVDNNDANEDVHSIDADYNTGNDEDDHPHNDRVDVEAASSDSENNHTTVQCRTH